MSVQLLTPLTASCKPVQSANAEWQEVSTNGMKFRVGPGLDVDIETRGQRTTLTFHGLAKAPHATIDCTFSPFMDGKETDGIPIEETVLLPVDALPSVQAQTFGTYLGPSVDVGVKIQYRANMVILDRDSAIIPAVA
jgi:hypothetical protein